MNEVSHILADLAQGDAQAAGKLLPLVYDELRKLAAARMREEAPGHTLNAIALVHEAYLRLVGPSDEARWDNRGHFFAAAAEAMRRILVEAARRKQRTKHGGDCERVELDAAQPVAPDPRQDLVALDAALTRLAVVDPQAAKLVAGTPLFMSPEQARGEPTDHRADLFSLGSVLYTMCCGRPPFRASSTLAVLKRVAEDTPRPIPEIIPEAPAWLCDLIARLQAKKPENRFASAREVADLLARSQANRHSVCPDCPAAGKLPRLPARRRWAVAACVPLLLGLVGIGVTEAVGVTNFRGTVIRLFSPEGTLVVEVDDPDVTISVDGEEVIITGTGAREIRLKPGPYNVKAIKDGKTLRQELVQVERNGKRVVRVSREAPLPPPTLDHTAWEKSVAALPAEEQVKAVVARLKHLNSRFTGEVTPAAAASELLAHDSFRFDSSQGHEVDLPLSRRHQGGGPRFAPRHAAAIPYPNTRSKGEWDEFLLDLNLRWGGQWANPGKK